MIATSSSRAAAALAAAALLLAGCVAPGAVVPGQMSASDLHDRVGMPTDIRFAPNGDELWEYARGPSGTETYVMRLDRDGQVREVTQVLTQERFSQIRVGATTKADMRALLGRPSDLRYLRSGLVWDWRVRIGPELGHYAVRFDEQGIVREKMVLTDMQTDGGDKGGK